MIRTTGIALLLSLMSAPAFAVTDMTVQKWYAGCEAIMTTNHFELAPGDTSEPIYLDYSGCTPEEMDSLIVFGYITSKSKSKQLTTKDNIRLSIAMAGENLDEPEMAGGDGSVLMSMAAEEQGCWVYAENLNKRKTVKLRLRAQLLGQ